MASETAERRPGFDGICLLRALPVACRFLSDDAAQPGGSGQRRITINGEAAAEAEEEADEKRRRTRAAVEEPGAMPCMYRYRSRHRGR